MSKKTRLVLLVLLALSMIISAMASCGGSGDKPSGSSKKSGTKSTAEITSEDEDVVSEEVSETAEVSSAAAASTVKSTAGTKSQATTSNKKIADTVSQAKIKDPLSVNLKGATIKVFTSSETGSAFTAKAGSSQTADARLAAIKKIQDKMNCKVSVQTGTNDTVYQQSFTAIASGKSIAHVIETSIHKTSAYIASDMIVNLKSIQTLDLTQSYMKFADAINASTIGRGTWLTVTEDDMTSGAYGVFFNKRILNEIKYTDAQLYKLVNDGKWTLSKFAEIAKAAVKDLDGKAGMTAADRFGLLSIDDASTGMLNVLTTSGAEMLKSNGKGQITYNMEDTKVLNAIDKGYDIFVKDGFAYRSTDETLRNMFTTGHGLFFMGGAFSCSIFSDMEDDFGYLPFPKGDNASSGATAVNWNNLALMIGENLSATELSNAGSFLQAFCYMSQEMANARRKEYNDRYFRDDESTSMLKKAVNEQKVVVSEILGSQSEWSIHEGTFRVLYNRMVGTAAATTIGESKSAAVTALKELMDVMN